MITYKDSVSLAKKLRALSPGILGIELFGSVLSKGHGRDADFIILVKDALAKHWWMQERGSIRIRWPNRWYEQRWIIKTFAPFLYSTTTRKRRYQRLQTAARMLDIALEDLADSHGDIPDFEMFLVPSGWRVEKELNTALLRQITDLVGDKNTLGFLRRVARESTMIA